MNKKINHCSHCECENFCAAHDWKLYGEYDPCCPNMKPGRKQYKDFLEQYYKEKNYF